MGRPRIRLKAFVQEPSRSASRRDLRVRDSVLANLNQELGG
jgi:hypothetical protein